MFLSSFGKMRKSIVTTNTIVNLVHMPYLGKGGTSLGINFGTTAVIFNKRYCRDYKSQFDYICYYETDEDGVPFAFPTINERYKAAKATSFSKIPGSPVAYWVGEAFLDCFRNDSLGEIVKSRQGLACGDVNYFRREWYEVFFSNIDLTSESIADFHSHGKTFAPINDGGEYRKWYGNNSSVLRFDKTSYDTLLTMGNHLPSRELYFHNGITWTAITTKKLSLRYFDNGFLFSNAGMAIFGHKQDLLLILAFINSSVAEAILSAISPTMNYNAGDIANLPMIITEYSSDIITKICSNCIKISKADWDSCETSWDFKRNPLV